MKLLSPFKVLSASLNDIWKMHDFNYQLPKDNYIDYWDQEFILHPTNSHCKIYSD